MAISDDIDGVSDLVDALDNQAPAAITLAIATVAASGGDPNGPAAVTRLKASVAKLTTDLQSAVAGATGAMSSTGGSTGASGPTGAPGF